MARQDLLDQGRAGPRHAHDEHRIRGGAALPGVPGEEPGIELRDRLVDHPAGLLRRVGQSLTAQGIGGRIMREGRRALAAVVERFAEREAEVEAVLRAGLRSPQPSQHRGLILGAEPGGLEIGD